MRRLGGRGVHLAIHSGTPKVTAAPAQSEIEKLSRGLRMNAQFLKQGESEAYISMGENRMNGLGDLVGQ
jgi:hypothetical protein